jgi:predicted oxidoreductase
MDDRLRGLLESAAKRTAETRAQALAAINQLVAIGKTVNFSSVHKHSGISKNFLYTDEEIRKRIEVQRACDVDNEMNRRAKYDKTSRSKDVIIATKDKRIAKLEAENSMLKMELEHLRGLLYAGK